MKLLKTHSITFTVPGAGYMDSNMRWVDGATSSLNTKGSLQSGNSPKQTLTLPDGYRTTDLKAYISKDLIPIVDEFNTSLAAYTVIGGRTFHVWDVEDNTGFGLKSDHYKYFLLREPLNSGALP